MLDYKPNIVLATGEYDVVGTRPIRHDGPDKVLGRARYAADINLTGMLYGKLYRSPHPHARIKSIDATRALALPGVKAVVTAADFPEVSAAVADQEEGSTVNYGFYSRNIIAREKALYRGHAVAAVAATSQHIAEQALSLLDVEFEVLPPVLTLEDATRDGAPALHERLLTGNSPNARAGGWGDEDSGTNVANRFEFRAGDLEKGFADADVIVEREFTTKAVHQGYIEPHSATAQWNTTDDSVTIWCSSQGHFALRDHTSVVLGVNVSKVKIVPMEIGGGFGGKGQGGCYLEPVAAALARKAGQPVKLTMTRTEVFEGTGPTSASTITVKMGATRDGKITAAEAHLNYLAGAFPGSPVPSGCRTMLAPYDIANAYIEGVDVVVNTQKAAALPRAGLACRGICRRVGHRRNLPEDWHGPGGFPPAQRRQRRHPPGHRAGFPGASGSRNACKQPNSTPTWRRPLRDPTGAGAWLPGHGSTAAVPPVPLPASTPTAPSAWSRVRRTSAAAGRRWPCTWPRSSGIPVEEVKPAVVDTDSIGYSSGAGGSGVTFKMGTACYEAGVDIKRQMVERAASIWGVEPDDVEYDGGILQHKRDPELRTDFKSLARRLNGTGGPIVGRATANPAGVGNAFALHVVDVEVDPETGKVDILRYTSFQDAGKAIHPSYVEGQMQGGAVQGIGWALNEEYYFNDQGQMMNSSFLDYRMPTSLDLPMMDTVIIEVPNPGHPFGVRGTGEVPLVPPMAAIANAINDAIGVRMEKLPMSPGAILDTIWEQAK